MCEPRSRSYQLLEIGFILDAESMGIRQRWTDRMSKSQDRKKDTKKKPLLTAKEKKKEKNAKKNETDVLGH